jgi:hexokinase
MTVSNPVDLLFSDLEHKFILNKIALKPIVQGFVDELNTGLTTPSTKLATMIPSFVTKLPTGNEKGTFLSLDMGGTNLRISAVELKGHGEVEVLELKRVASKELKTGEGSEFFDWIADTMDELVHVKAKHLFSAEQLEGKETLALGICWSFPVQ